ncbi:ABC transporter permease [Aliikangiella coralliicola]|uniref:FtsX-like permease family protein n=1 Tax=Aliikangiella coralliicola TaxID=2592383 RepID=A0A545UJK3_9GAMM|nr:ABC transporter permease [Aliikangiella coralliicola]TQV89646.1 FtsX-like permease family protein [Aliikangiella coralliicola]
MLKDGLFVNYLLTAFRSSKRDKINFVLTILGLSIGMAASLLIALYAINENAYDEFQPNAKQTYRLIQHHLPTGNDYPLSTPRATQHLKKLSGVEDVFQLVRTLWLIENRVKIDDQYFKLEKNFAATENIKDFISINTLRGNLTEALTHPDRLALSESEAIRLFGTTDIIGETLPVKNSNDTWTVVAVFSDLPDNSHFSINSLIAATPYIDVIGSHSYTYVRLSENADIKIISDATSRIFADIWGWDINQLQFYLQPLLDIHLAPNIKHDMKVGGSANTVSITIMLSILLLLISSFNYINMSIAQGGRRAKEVGIRKVLGAGRLKLVLQFLGESVIFALFSALIAASIVELILPAFNQLVGRELTIGNWSSIIVPVMFVTLLIGLISGIYPALFMSSFSLKRVISGDLERGKTAVFVRKCSMVFQSGLSVGLIIAAVNLYLQFDHLQNLPVNYEKSSRLQVIDAPHEKIYAQENDSFFQALTKISGVKSATPIDFELTKSFYAGIYNVSVSGEKPFSDGIGYGGTGYNAAETIGLQLVAGRDFSKEFTSDWFNKETKTMSIMIPESALSTVGYANADEAIGKTWQFSAGRYHQINALIVGVFKDIKVGSVKESYTPAILGCGLSWSSVYSILLQVSDQDSITLHNEVRELMRKQLHIDPVEIQVVEANYFALYYEDKRLAKTVAIFSGLAVFLTCIGMFGLAAYSAQRRSQEVAIRKVLGASRLTLVSLLAKESILLVGISLLFAFPFTFYLLNDWLSQFNERIEQSLPVYLLAGLVVSVITWLTVLTIALHTASVRPAFVLRCE